MNLEQAREEWDNAAREVWFCETHPWGSNAYGDRDEWLANARDEFKSRLPKHSSEGVLRRWVRAYGLHWSECDATGPDGPAPLTFVGDSAESATRAARAWSELCKAELAEVEG